MPESKGRILIVDDEPLKRTMLEEELQSEGFSVNVASNPLEAEPFLKTDYYDVVITDLRMPGKDGLTFLNELKEMRADQAVIVMTAYGTVETAVEAIKLGAFDYMQKPFSTEELLLKLDKLLRFESLAKENEALRQQLAVTRKETRFIGQSDAVRNVLKRIHTIAGIDTTVLIEGESGTGKELAARTVHETSFRASGPFVAVSCAILPKELVESELFGHEAGSFTGATKRRIGRFEIAHEGTIFLDDVDDIPLDVQVKLLRVLQERTFERVGGHNPIRANVRVIAATKKSLKDMVKAGEFREDLYYRLNVVPLHMPLLKEMIDDIPYLAEHFLQIFAVKFNRDITKISPKALAKLRSYHWPGNIRELEHVFERMVALCEKNELGEDDVPDLEPSSDSSGPVTISLKNEDSVDLEKVIAQTEEQLIRWAMNKSGGNLSHASELLHVPRSTLQYKLSKLKESPEDN
jgi:DNA-binding NtrC family response regulator